VGWELRRRAFRKKVVLELGGNAGLVVDRTADLDLAAARTVAGGFGYAGQSCISVQRVYAHREIHDTFLEKVLSLVSELEVGDPLEERVTVGPMISIGDAERVERWIREARDGGAAVLAGGGRQGSLVEPTVLTGTKAGMKVCDEEVFAPVVVVEPVASFREAVDAVNRSEFGLQAGVFTRDLGNAMAAFREIEVGAVIVNDAPTFRADPMPYGGVKSSGSGREGPRYAIEDYTEPRLLVLSRF
jgi:glyceraldehyde-3-phosphate dehydrogenase (NADP+)